MYLLIKNIIDCSLITLLLYFIYSFHNFNFNKRVPTERISLPFTSKKSGVIMMAKMFPENKQNK